MACKTYRFRVAEARRIRHPAIPTIEKHYFLMRAKDVPKDIIFDANAREPVGLNRQVYRDVRDSLLLGDGWRPGAFDLMNKGIVVLSKAVRRLNDREYEVDIEKGQGIVDGAHTYAIITSNQDSPDLDDCQHVEFQIRTGVPQQLVTDIARGLNTAIQVKLHSLANLDKAFAWIKDEISTESYSKQIAWKEGDEGEFDVRDLICVLEALNVIDFPNNEGSHPISAYEKGSAPLARFVEDHQGACDTKGKFDPRKSKYHKLRPLLRGALVLFDTIRRDFRDVHNENGGSAGKMRIVEECSPNRPFEYLFAKLDPSQYRLTKGALYPIFAAFRNAVAIDPKTGDTEWIDGFDSVLQLWQRVRQELVAETYNATRDIGNLPDQLGKSRSHWVNLHKTLKVHILERQVAQSGKHRATSRIGT